MSWLHQTAAILMVTLFCGLSLGQAPKLGVGDKAPPLAVAKWLKGKPLAKLEKNTIYVIEFWASWCPPCRQSVPHLTALQKKYPEVVVIGVNSMERGPTAAVQFVREMGEQMDYRVAVDMNNRMSRTWMSAAGQEGIPCAFVVDKEGLIAWIGHPMRLETVLADLHAEAPSGEVEGGPLRVGSRAPALATGRWIKGEPVEALELGKVYVVEFWATWCAPCRESIPHLTKLQKQFPSVTFIGQNVSERDPAAPEAFVKEMGENMGYRVALDTAEQSMSRDWLQAAGQNGIPCAFVVGKDGKVAWIGHPMRLGEVLPRINSRPAKAAATQPVE